MIDDLALARALHVLAVIHWIGGLAFVTLVILPLAKSRGDAGLALFTAVEHRFSRQVRLSVPVVGVTGFWMVWRMDIWGRFLDPEYWWMGAMLGLWLLFMVVLFGVEPIIARRTMKHESVASVRLLGVAHRMLLIVATLTAFGAVAGAHGFSF